MSWLFLSLLSALFLGIYDLCKKASVGNNAVAAVLLLSCLTGALIWVPFVLLSATDPAFAENEFLYVDPLSPSDFERLVQEMPGFVEGDRNDALDYLELFYRVLESEGRYRREVVEACRRMPG